VRVPYTLDYNDDAHNYLRTYEGLSRLGRVKLFGLIDEIRNITDEFRLNPVRRPIPDSPIFVVDRLLLDQSKVFYFRIFVDDSAAEFSVLRIEYIDAQVREYAPIAATATSATSSPMARPDRLALLRQLGVADLHRRKRPRQPRRPRHRGARSVTARQ
jgi:hypothetical protein